jgi:hypothetical protein
MHITEDTKQVLCQRTPHHRPRLRAAQSVSRADSANCPLHGAPSGRRNLFLTRSSRPGGPNATTRIRSWLRGTQGLTARQNSAVYDLR